MSDRSSTLFRAMLLSLALLGGIVPRVAARQAIIANDPVALTAPDETPISSKASEQPGHANSATAAEPHSISTAGDPPKPLAVVGPASKTPPASESKGLGKPTSLFSVRPAETSKESGGRDVLSKLDPRTNEISRVLAALAVVIGILLLVRTLMRRAGNMTASGSRPSGVLEILARYPVAHGQQLVLLKLSRRIVLLHQNGSAMTTLTEITDPDEVAALLAKMEAGSGAKDAAKFRATLNQFQQEHETVQSKPAKPRNSMPSVEAEIVDLTRNRGLGKGIGRNLGAILGRNAAR